MMENPVGQRVKIARKYMKLSQEGLAKVINVTQSAISRAEENGSVSNELAEYMNKIHKINLNWLFTGEGEMIEKPQDELIEKLREELADAKDLIIALYREKDDLQRQLNKKAS